MKCCSYSHFHGVTSRCTGSSTGTRLLFIAVVIHTSRERTVRKKPKVTQPKRRLRSAALIPHLLNILNLAFFQIKTRKNFLNQSKKSSKEVAVNRRAKMRGGGGWCWYWSLLVIHSFFTHLRAKWLDIIIYRRCLFVRLSLAHKM